MNTRKRIVSAILVVLMLVSVIPTMAFTASAAQPETTDITVQTTPVTAPDASEEYPMGDYFPIEYDLPENTSQDSLRPAGTTITQPLYFAPGEGKATAVKDQGQYGTCWAFSACAAAEANLLTKGLTYDYGKEATADTLDFSELYLAYFFYNSGPDPLGNTTGDVNAIVGSSYLTGGGNNMLTTFGVLNWKGMANESLAPYNSITGPLHPLDPALAWQSSAHCQNVFWINMVDVNLVKQMIVDYGGVVISYCHSALYYHPTDASYFCGDKSVYYNFHSVCIVGWDDTFNRYGYYYFDSPPPGPGAWIVKNSWGPNWGMTSPGAQGFYYMSYYDATMRRDVGVVFDYEDADNYDNNYQYDGACYIDTLSIPAQVNDPTRLANQYEVKASDYERLDAVGFALESPNVNYRIQVYKKDSMETFPDDGTPMLETPVTGKTSYTGYITVPLNQELIFEKGDVYSIIIDIWAEGDNASVFVETCNFENSWVHTVNDDKPGESWFAWGQEAAWADLHYFIFPLNTAYKDGYTLRIKGYTNNVAPVNMNLTGLTSDATSDYTRLNHPYSVTLTPYDGIDLPQTVTVTGADYTYDPETGVIDIENVTGEITITATAIGEHEHDYVPATTPATCTSGGIIIYTCSICGDTRGEYLPALGHDFGDWFTVTEATAAEDGLRRRECSRCDAFEEEAIPATGECTEHNYVGVETTAPCCITEGVMTYTCSICGDSYTESIPALGHLFGEGLVIVEPTETEPGYMLRGCGRPNCGISEKVIIPPLGTGVMIKNYDLTFSHADNINAIRIAKGNFTTASDIKNAPGCININKAVITAGLDADNNYVYELPDGGVWSVWYKLDNGTTRIVSGLDNTLMNPEIDTYGVTMTVKNLYGVKDFYFAKGIYLSYRDVKDAEGCVGVTRSKFGDAHSYTYGAAVGEPGQYTCVIRFEDPDRSDMYLPFTCEVTAPTVDVFGKNITVGNIDDIRVIRVAPGTFDNVNAIKNAEGVRNFTASTIAKLGFTDSLTVNNAANEDGSDTFYTISIEYRNLYTEVHNITINKLMPEYTVNGDSIKLTGLEGFTLLRYAPGTYTTATDIKNAAGSKYVKGTDNTIENITLNGLHGAYTFLVQYNENSMNIFTVEF